MKKDNNLGFKLLLGTIVLVSLVAILIGRVISFNSTDWREYTADVTSHYDMHEEKVILLYLALKDRHPNEANALWKDLKTLHQLQVDQGTWNKSQKKDTRRNLQQEFGAVKDSLERHLTLARSLARDVTSPLPDSGAQLAINWEFTLE